LSSAVATPELQAHQQDPLPSICFPFLRVRHEQASGGAPLLHALQPGHLGCQTSWKHGLLRMQSFMSLHSLEVLDSMGHPSMLLNFWKFDTKQLSKKSITE
jgi:hypothetical protein